MGYHKKALFVYSKEGSQFLEKLSENPYDCQITPCTVEAFENNADEWGAEFRHIVVSAELAIIKEVILRARNLGCSVGFLPFQSQKMLLKCFAIPVEHSEMIDLALQSDSISFDLVFCNEQLILYKAVIGRLPLFDSLQDDGRLQVIMNGLVKLVGLRLLPFTIETKGEKPVKISTAASGCLVLETTDASFASRMISEDCSFRDGMISMLFMAPFSIMDYFKLMWRRIVVSSSSEIGLSSSTGYIKSQEITLRSDKERGVFIDGDRSTVTPAEFRVEAGAVRVNHGLGGESQEKTKPPAKEKVAISSLPTGRELQKALRNRIPIFSYASEERFKDLFLALRDDVRLDSTYVVLMILSTVLATVGLYLNSGSVIIGAMLLAPLMAPIIGLAMGLLRYDRRLVRQALIKIGLGVMLALITSLVFSLLSPYQPITGEMQGRLHPTVLDLIVAVVAGIAGAYTKSFKEILQSLAGVAIAVALVPPLAVAGIGIGRFDPVFFANAFLLFLTNFIGIVLAATITFRVLGYSAVVRDRKGMILVVAFFCLIVIPLSISFSSMVSQKAFESGWKYERFLVNGKYLIVKEAELQNFGDQDVLIVDLHARDPLSREDLTEFRRKIRYNFSENILIRATVTYIP